jgi:ribonucleoside-diphosphate reductase alpha chain
MIMHVVKRSGKKEEVSFDKILEKVRRLSVGLNSQYVDPTLVTKKVIEGLYDGVTTVELDALAAETCAGMSTVHPDYLRLAARIEVDNLHRETSDSFVESMKILYEYVDPKTKKKSSLIGQETYESIVKNADLIEQAIDYTRDFDYDYFGFKTLERTYLLRAHGRIIERPQHMLMRVSVGLWGDDIENVIRTYELMSQSYFTHATPTLFNAGTRNCQLSSCFLVAMKALMVFMGP